MKDYLEFRYLYPPRPDFALTSDRIPAYEKQGWVGQIKKNGTCTIVAISPEGTCIAMNRHNQDHKAWNLTANIINSLREIIPRRHWTVMVGEIMHSKTKDIKDTIFFHDVIVHESKQLVGVTFEERQKILEKLLPATKGDLPSHYQVTDKIWRANLIREDILSVFQAIKDPTIDEGIVLKLSSSKLKDCWKADSNCSWQYKIRHPSNKYSF